MNILAYIPKRSTPNVRAEWLYGADIIWELRHRHPEWKFKILDGKFPKQLVYLETDVYIRPTRHDANSIMILECKALGIPFVWSYETGKYIEPTVEYFEKRLKEIEKGELR